MAPSIPMQSKKATKTQTQDKGNNIFRLSLYVPFLVSWRIRVETLSIVSQYMLLFRPLVKRAKIYGSNDHYKQLYSIPTDSLHYTMSMQRLCCHDTALSKECGVRVTSINKFRLSIESVTNKLSEVYMTCNETRDEV